MNLNMITSLLFAQSAPDVIAQPSKAVAPAAVIADASTGTAQDVAATVPITKKLKAVLEVHSDETAIDVIKKLTEAETGNKESNLPGMKGFLSFHNFGFGGFLSDQRKLALYAGWMSGDLKDSNSNAYEVIGGVTTDKPEKGEPRDLLISGLVNRKWGWGHITLGGSVTAPMSADFIGLGDFKFGGEFSGAEGTEKMLGKGYGAKPLFEWNRHFEGEGEAEVEKNTFKIGADLLLASPSASAQGTPVLELGAFWLRESQNGRIDNSLYYNEYHASKLDQLSKYTAVMAHEQVNIPIGKDWYLFVDATHPLACLNARSEYTAQYSSGNGGFEAGETFPNPEGAPCGATSWMSGLRHR